MTVRVHGKNMQVPNEIREFVMDRVAHAGRIFDDGGDIDVEFTESRNPRRIDSKFKVEITTNVAGHIVRIEAEAGDERTAVDKASDRYERQLRKLKTKLIQRNRVSNKGVEFTDIDQGVIEDVDDGGVEIVRTKRFIVKPMSPEEAAMQMDLLDHGFFFFLDAESNKYCVVYQRRDGNVGLIEPD